MKGLRFCCLLLALLVISVNTAYSGSERRIEKNYKADSIQRIEVSAFGGKIHVVSSEDSQIHLNLMIKPERFKNVDLDAADLVETFSGNSLKLELDAPFDKDDIEENWELTVPARLQADLDVNVGDVHVQGVAGGLKLNANVGRISCDVPEGKIHARVGVGSIQASSRTSSYGKVQLDSNVGNVKLNLGNHAVKYQKPPGAGNRISLEGPGKDEIDLAVNVGNAELEIAKD
ncbi:MAG TPA: hypothetical protein VLH08_16075 [Acidobacteriota bacterium]|nr:hypothetical protein [Acidobacteriota bacterium]